MAAGSSLHRRRRPVDTPRLKTYALSRRSGAILLSNRRIPEDES
jgi:hypothetical protein